MAIRKTFTVILILTLMVIALFVFELFRSEPPAPTVAAGNTNITTVQGSYCWNGLLSAQCVDKAYASPLDMAKEHKPTVVSPNERVTIKFRKEPIAGTFAVEQLIDEGKSIEVEVSSESIMVPGEKGIYMYYMHANWEQGSGSYTFSVEVK